MNSTATGTLDDNLQETPVFHVTGLSKVYSMGEVDVHALRGVDLEVREGEFIVLLGHSGSGKTSLVEAMLFKAGVITQRGSIEKGSTHSDFTEQEKAHQNSLEPSLLSLDHQNTHINFLDTPGHPDFFGRAIGVLPGVNPWYW